MRAFATTTVPGTAALAKVQVLALNPATVVAPTTRKVLARVDAPTTLSVSDPDRALLAVKVLPTLRVNPMAALANVVAPPTARC